MKLPNGYGSISKLSGNRRRPYVVRKNREIVGYVKTREEGLALLAKINENPEKYKSEKTTFADVYQLLVKYKCPQISPHTAQNYKSKFNKCKELHDIPYKDLRLPHFLNAIDTLEKTNGSKNNLKKFFRAMDSIASQFDIITKEYSKLLPNYKNENSKRKPFSEKEIEKLWDNLDIEDVDLILILIYTGLRSGELGDLKIKDIKLDKDYLTGGNKTNAGKDRVIPIHPRIKPLIERRMELAKGETLLNYSSKQLRIRFKKAVTKLGMNHIPHECRHTMRTRLDNENVNANIINLIMGHTSGGVGERVYTHKTLSQLIEAVEKLD